MDTIIINGAIASAKAAATILSALSKLKLDHETLVRVNEALQQVADVQQQLFGTHEQLYTLQKERDELQQQLKNRTDWEKEKAGYKLVETSAGAFILESVEAAPKHHVCPVCIADRKLIPLNKLGDYTLRCPACDKRYQFDKPPPAPRMERRPVRFGKGA
jgi:hypothetical protein